MKASDIMAIIPARSGSKSVRDKNITLLGGYPLLAYTIIAARLSRKIDRVIVSTDSQYYADVAAQYGAEVPFLRPAELSSDASTDRDFMLHAMQWMQENESHVPEYWVHLRPTTPLRQVDVIDQAIDEIQRHPEATSLRSGHLCPESPLKWFKRDDAGFFHGLLDDESEYYNLPKQAFPDVYIPDGYVDVVRASCAMNNESLHGEAIRGFMSPICTEVDSPGELRYLEYQLQHEGSSLLSWLQEHYPQEQ